MSAFKNKAYVSVAANEAALVAALNVNPVAVAIEADT